MQNDIYNINKQIKNICDIIILNLIRISRFTKIILHSHRNKYNMLKGKILFDKNS